MTFVTVMGRVSDVLVFKVVVGSSVCDEGAVPTVMSSYSFGISSFEISEDSTIRKRPNASAISGRITQCDSRPSSRRSMNSPNPKIQYSLPLRGDFGAG